MFWPSPPCCILHRLIASGEDVGKKVEGDGGEGRTKVEGEERGRGGADRQQSPVSTAIGTTSLLLHLTALSQFALCDFKQ